MIIYDSVGLDVTRGVGDGFCRCVDWQVNISNVDHM